VSRSGDHPHGFYQGIDRPCEPGKKTTPRVLSVWADYNAAEYSHAEAAELYCGAQRAALKVSVPPDRGWVVSCQETIDGGGESLEVAFFAKEPDPELAFGLDQIRFLYSVGLTTDRAHREADIELFREFLAQLELTGTRVAVDR
jgi:hypothetical protein